MKLKNVPIKHLFFGLFAFFLVSCNQEINTEVNIIPQPQEVVFSKGSFPVKEGLKIVFADETLKQTAEYLQAEIEKEFKVKTTVETGTNVKDAVNLVLKEGYANEAYSLDVQSKKVVCEASDETGVFYAIQSFIQTIKNTDGKLAATCVTVKDAPAYPWRGMMLDEARHFFGKDVVKQQLDLMARLKLNRFHWHLTDEPAWRIEIKKYPLLTEIGSTGSWSDSKAPSAFYTQEEIKEIVAYAAQRHIMVIPEIDMPGHATAAARSYPEISGGGTGRWKDFTFHPAKDYTYEFISNIFTEVAELFPAPYIHIGADEVHFGNQSWYTDKQIQKFIKDNNLKDEVGLEHYFVRRVCDSVTSKGKIMLGWDEVIGAGVKPDSVIVMWWRHDKPKQLSLALEQKFNVILTPRIPCYFDFVQDNSHKIGRRWGGKFNELTTVYHFPDSIQHLLKGYEKQVLGTQANLWTERVKDKKRLDFMFYPRVLAIAEDAWTKQGNKNYADFERRTKVFMKYLDSLNIYYFNMFDPESTPEPWGPEKADVLADG